MLNLRCGSSIWNSVSQPLLLQGSPAPMELYCVDLDYMSWVTQNGMFPNGQWWLKPPSFTTSSCSRKNYIEAFDDLKCCVEGRPFGEGLYPTVSVPFSPNQSDLQTYDIFLVFSATDFHFKSRVVFQLKNAEALRWISLHVLRWGGKVIRVSGRLENRCKLIEVSTKTV